MKYPNKSEKAPISPPANGPNIIPPNIMGNFPRPILIPSTPPIATRRLATRVKTMLKAIRRPIVVILWDDIFIFYLSLLDIALL
jgi:hypothetical protein